jgi:hypothetical protein
VNRDTNIPQDSQFLHCKDMLYISRDDVLTLFLDCHHHWLETEPHLYPPKSQKLVAVLDPESQSVVENCSLIKYESAKEVQDHYLVFCMT